MGLGSQGLARPKHFVELRLKDPYYVSHVSSNLKRRDKARPLIGCRFGGQSNARSLMTPMLKEKDGKILYLT